MSEPRPNLMRWVLHFVVRHGLFVIAAFLLSASFIVSLWRASVGVHLLLSTTVLVGLLEQGVDVVNFGRWLSCWVVVSVSFGRSFSRAGCRPRPCLLGVCWLASLRSCPFCWASRHRLVHRACASNVSRWFLYRGWRLRRLLLDWCRT